MDSPSLRLRLVFEDRSLLSESQRSEGMSRSWLLIEPHLHRNISDVCNHLLHIFNLRSSCPDGILLYMEGFVLPPSESTRILKDKEVICVKKKGVGLNEAIEGADACNFLDDGEDNKRAPMDNGILLLANEEFDKETGGYRSESEEERLEDEPSPKEKVSKKRKASTKLSSSKKKKHCLAVMDGVEDEVAIEDDNVNSDECLPKKIMSKKTKRNKKGCAEAESIDLKIKSPPKVKRKKKHLLEVVNGAEDEVVTDEIENVDSGLSLITKMISKKKKGKPKEETKKENIEKSEEKVKPSDVKRRKNLQDNVNGVEQASTAPDGAKKVPSRNARRKKAKRQWIRELAKVSKETEIHPEPEVSKAGNKESNGHPKGHDQMPTKLAHRNTMEQEEKNVNGNVHTELVPYVVRPGHIRFEPLDEDDDAEQVEVPDVAFQWNGITSKKKGQKWGIEKYSTNQRDDFQKASREPSKMLSADTEVLVVDLNDFDKLPLCSSPKEGDVIAYRLVELSSTWTPELSSFRVGKISKYDANNIILLPVPEYPIVIDKMEEGGPDNSLYGEDGSLEIKYAALVDVRIVKQSNSDDMQAVSYGVNRSAQSDDNGVDTNLMPNINENKENLSEDPSPVTKTQADTWEELEAALSAKKSELLELNEEMKRDSGRNRWSYRALRGSALGPTMALLRSKNEI